jgi:hypothetical protein
MTINITLTQHQANLLLLALEAYGTMEGASPDQAVGTLRLHEHIFDKGIDAGFGFFHHQVGLDNVTLTD